jgi:hypothetical protein
MLSPFSRGSIYIDEYITTVSNNTYRQVDWLVIAEKGIPEE